MHLQPASQMWVKPGKRWERGWAIVGIVYGFIFLLVIPGLIGLFHYERWQRREGPCPTGFIVWGLVMTGLLVLAIVLGIGIGNA